MGRWNPSILPDRAVAKAALAERIDSLIVGLRMHQVRCGRVGQ